MWGEGGGREGVYVIGLEENVCLVIEEYLKCQCLFCPE